MKISKHYNTVQTHQTQKIPGSDQVKNSAGGFSFQVDDWKRLDRFMVLGTEGGSYYAKESDLTVSNCEAARRCIKADGLRTVRQVVEISHSGRAPKNDYALFVLAMCAKLGDENTRRAANRALPKVARIGTHLFQYADDIKALGGWGSGTVRSFQNWYLNKPVQKLALQAIKYQQRNGWSHRDVLRKAHPKASGAHNDLFKYITQGVVPKHRDLEIVRAFERAKTASKEEVISLIREYGLPRECVPSQYLKDPEVWEAMLPTMGLTAMIRNLGNMTRIGLIKPLSSTNNLVMSRLTDADELKNARVHPLQILMAMRTYIAGRGLRGSNTWQPVPAITDALDKAFYASFKFVEPTGKRFYLGLDVSGSMGAPTFGGNSYWGAPSVEISPREGSVAMAMVTARTEANYHLAAFHHSMVPFDISARERLDTAMQKTAQLPWGRTDCALPMLDALERELEVDVFTVYTDSETYYGNIHPTQALKKYRKASGIPAKLVVVSMVANSFSIADPNDAGMLDVSGWDSAVPSLLADFARE